MLYIINSFNLFNRYNEDIYLESDSLTFIYKLSEQDDKDHKVYPSVYKGLAYSTKNKNKEKDYLIIIDFTNLLPTKTSVAGWSSINYASSGVRKFNISAPLRMRAHRRSFLVVNVKKQSICKSVRTTKLVLTLKSFTFICHIVGYTR